MVYLTYMKIFIFGLVIAFLFFKISYWSNAYGNVVELGPMEKTIGDISSTECKEILNNGNIMEYPDLSKGQQFWVIIYNYKEYFVEKYQVTRSTGMSGTLPVMAYTCHGAQELKPAVK